MSPMPTPLPLSPALPPAAAAADEPAALDLILIEGWQGQTVIGIHDDELHRPQPLVIDLHAGQPRARACSTDRIGDTIDYGAVCARLDALMLDHGVQLLEALAERIARLLLDDFGASWVRVRIVKPRKFAHVASVGVQIERRAASPAPRPGAQVLGWIGSGLVPQVPQS